MKADWALLGGNVESPGTGRAKATALAVAGDRVIAIGEDAEIRACCDAGTEVRDLAGSTVLPGFIDTHMHLEKIAGELAMLQLEALGSVAEVVAAVRRAAERDDGRFWIRAFGDDGAWHECRLQDGRLPVRSELDDASPRRPVFLYRGPDAAALNSVAVELLHERLRTVAAADWDQENGILTGPEARALNAELPDGSDEHALAELANASNRLLAMGLTSLVDPGLPGGFDSAWRLYTESRARGELRQRVYLMNRFDPRHSAAEEIARVGRSPALPGEGDDFLRAWSVKMLLDGEFDNAWMRDGEFASGEPLRRYEPDEVRLVLECCAEAGWPLCVHAMGGGAIACVLEELGRAVQAGVELAPDQVSIAHGFLAGDADLAACRELGVAISVQPMLAYVFEDAMLDGWGELAERANRFRAMVEAGVDVSGGSDTLPCEPLRGAAYAVNRTARRGTALGLEEALTAEQAIALFTSAGAPYMRRSDIGCLAPGYLADFAIWPRSPFDLPVEQWTALEPEMTVVGGEIAWAA